jgi:hypothetical protein
LPGATLAISSSPFPQAKLAQKKKKKERKKEKEKKPGMKTRDSWVISAQCFRLNTLI